MPPKFDQRGINMVDLMMWLVIAALLLATAIQGMNLYQQRSYIEQMSNDAIGAGTNALARVSMGSGELTESDIRDAIKDTSTTGEVTLISSNLGRGYFAIEAMHPSVEDYRVVYAFTERNGLRPGVNLTKRENIDAEAISSSIECANGIWRVDYYDEYQAKGVPTKEPLLSRCETSNVSYNWLDGAPAVSGMPKDKFSVHFTQNFEVPESKEYEFSIRSDNQSRVYLDGKEIIDNSRWYGSSTEVKAYLTLTPGVHNITIRYAENEGGAAIYAGYKPTS